MPVDSLLDMSLRACTKITKRITDIGGLPYSVARPFLLKVDSPEQLHTLEQNCEQIVGHDAEIWLALIRRDIPNWESKKHEPKDPKDWWEVYRNLKQEALLEMDAGADKLKAALNDKNDKQLAEIKPLKALAKPRGPNLQARVAYGYQSGRTGSKGSSKLGVLEKIKKEAREAKAARAIAEQQMKRRMATTVTRAPAQFVQDLKTQRQKPQQSPEKPIRVPRPPMAIRRLEAVPSSPSGAVSSTVSRSTAASSPSRPAVTYQQVQEREARLRALTSGNPLPANGARDFPSNDHLPRKETPVASTERLLKPIAQPEMLSASFLEEASPPNARRLLGDALSRPGSSGMSRSASPQIAPMSRKRKKEPDLFMASAKKKAVAVGSNSAL